METRQIFSRMFVTAKKIKSCSPEIAGSVRCVSSTLVVLDARLPDWLRRKRTKDDGEKGINTNIKLMSHS